MKTPMQELYERLWEADKDKFTWNAILKEMLEKEKQVIIDAHLDAYIDMNMAFRGADRAEEYYNETFNTKEK